MLRARIIQFAVTMILASGAAAPTDRWPQLRGPEPIGVVDDAGLPETWRAKTGQEIYGKQRIDPEAGAFTTSPWASNGKIFALSEDGDTFVIQAGKEFKVLGKNSLGEMCMATPAISRGSLIIRTASKLYRITEAGAPK